MPSRKLSSSPGAFAGGSTFVRAGVTSGAGRHDLGQPGAGEPFQRPQLLGLERVEDLDDSLLDAAADRLPRDDADDPFDRYTRSRGDLG